MKRWVKAGVCLAAYVGIWVAVSSSCKPAESVAGKVDTACVIAQAMLPDDQVAKLCHVESGMRAEMEAILAAVRELRVQAQMKACDEAIK